ncbi:hypothetical protein WQQ_37050 [Hydrocarboniphaga effusa AP103]|uniref:Uncharacterized protein n=1 Tax=Hydrocarboniphaga effusa AP103 TaxID=1172194 RepID=I8T3N5_9GAMM|nr:hypothetical protein WQQ_37050 [Hydrocarboniphaga effusa AP103]
MSDIDATQARSDESDDGPAASPTTALSRPGETSSGPRRTANDERVGDCDS